jgi:hypothetical protein
MYCLVHGGLALIPSSSRLRHKIIAPHYRARCMYEVRYAMRQDLRDFVGKATFLD